jgi:phosphoenolpyruvate carboxykinase (ATP)
MKKNSRYRRWRIRTHSHFLHMLQRTLHRPPRMSLILDFDTCLLISSLQPGRYAEMLAERMSKHRVDCWLINTGWTGGKFGTGKRCPLNYTRAIVDAVHSGELAKAEYETFGTFGLSIPTGLEGIPRELLNPRLAWPNKEAFEREVRKLAGMFHKAFALYERDVDEKVRLAGPIIN